MDNGKVEVTVPGLRAGQIVEVSVWIYDRESPPLERPLGLLKGKIHLAPDFDAPLEEFGEYM